MLLLLLLLLMCAGGKRRPERSVSGGEYQPGVGSAIRHGHPPAGGESTTVEGATPAGGSEIAISTLPVIYCNGKQ